MGWLTEAQTFHSRILCFHHHHNQSPRITAAVTIIHGAIFGSQGIKADNTKRCLVPSSRISGRWPVTQAVLLAWYGPQSLSPKHLVVSRRSCHSCCWFPCRRPVLSTPHSPTHQPRQQRLRRLLRPFETNTQSYSGLASTVHCAPRQCAFGVWNGV